MASRAERAPDWQAGFDAGIEAATPEWQDIATAPKDKLILIATAYGMVHLGRWGSLYYAHYADGKSVPAFGWAEHNTMCSEIRPATHWQPLPPPPTLKDTP